MGARRLPTHGLSLGLAAALVASTALATGSVATGSVATDASTVLAAGAAPRQGFVIVDPCAQTGTPPVLAAVAPPAAFAGAPAGPPDFDAGPGGTALSFAGTQTVPGGTYDCLSFGTPKNAVITFSGPTTIRAKSYVAIQGTVRTLSDDQPLTIVAGGDIQLGALNSFGAAITTGGARSDLTLQCGATCMLWGAPYPARVAAAQSSVHVRAGAASVAPDGFSAGLDVDVVAWSDVVLFGRTDGESQTPEGGITLSAGRDALLRSALARVRVVGCDVGAVGRLTIEAGGSVSIENEEAKVHADGGIDVAAYGGRIDVTGGALVTAGKTGVLGASTWRARDGIAVAGRSTFVFPPFATRFACGSEKLVLESPAGDVEVGMDGTPTPVVSVDADGAVEMRASATARVRAAGRVTAKNGVTMAGLAAAVVDAGVTLDGGVGHVVLESPECVSLAAGSSVVGGYVALASQTLVSVASTAAVKSTLDDLVVVAHDATIAGRLTARGKLRVSVTGGVADVRGATLATRDATGIAPSGAVEVVAYPGPTATILAQGASLRSGASATTSGDVVLRLVVPVETTGGTPGGGTSSPTTTRGDPPFVVPASVTVRPRRRAAAQDFELRGFVDLGASAALAAGAATVSVGDVEFAAELSVARSGVATARGADVVVSLGRPRPGSPRRPATIRARGVFLPEDLSGDLAVRLTLGGVEAACRVRVEDGRFDARRGALVEPKLYLADVRALRSGLVRVTLGLPTGKLAMSEAPAVVLELAGARWYVDRTALVPRPRGLYATTAPADDLRRVCVDPRARTIDVELAAEKLGVPDEGGALDVALRVNGGQTRLLRVVVGRDRGKLVY